jgi:hypothetical protein
MTIIHTPWLATIELNGVEDVGDSWERGKYGRNQEVRHVRVVGDSSLIHITQCLACPSLLPSRRSPSFQPTGRLGLASQQENMLSHKWFHVSERSPFGE